MLTSRRIVTVFHHTPIFYKTWTMGDIRSNTCATMYQQPVTKIDWAHSVKQNGYKFIIFDISDYVSSIENRFEVLRGIHTWVDFFLFIS